MGPTAAPGNRPLTAPRYGPCRVPTETAAIRKRPPDTAARAIRDSKDPHLEPLRFRASEWAAFRAGVIVGEL
ncbi:DUF397 domain-containing protein [Streptomyces sp. NPDC095613]|uniref:DUF397 domain-containing protein n=1 Tax=Streptomyces sp. NPDC095613 TaxID=3155540 RepID=UPI00331C7A09